MLLNVGASLTAVTLMAIVSVAALKAEVPPLLLASATLPAVPLVLSQARKVSVALPLQSVAGTKRTLYVVSSRRAVVSDGVPKATHEAPPLMLYCQVPLLLSTAVTAMASTSTSPSAMAPAGMRLAMVSPTALAVSSTMVASAGL